MATIQSNKTNIFSVIGTAFQIKPGTNEVDDGVWADAKKHPHVKVMLADGVIEVGKAKPDKPETDEKGGKAGEGAPPPGAGNAAT